MFPLSRRKVLILSGTALSAGIAGCSTVAVLSTETRLGDLRVENYLSEPHTIRILILEDGEPVYWNAVELEAVSDGRTYVEYLEGYPTREGSFVLYAWMDAQPKSEWQRLDLGEYDNSCLNLSIAITPFQGGAIRFYELDTDCPPDES